MNANSLCVADSSAAKYAGISTELWDKLKKNHPKILSPCAQTISGRAYYLKRDIEAALIANKPIVARQQVMPVSTRINPPFLAHPSTAH